MNTDAMNTVDKNIKEFRAQDPEGTYHWIKTGESGDGRKWISIDLHDWIDRSYALSLCEEELEKMAEALRWKRSQVKIMRAM